MTVGLLATSIFAITAAATPDAGTEPAAIQDAGAEGPSHARSAAFLWSEQHAPAPGPPEAIGAYAAGCLRGAVPLAPSGPGYELLHLKRDRRFGHPTLVDFVRRLGATARTRRLGLVVIGDLSQARGGPTPTGHRSHQTGLDVDIGYTAPAGLRTKRLSPLERERSAPPAVVDLQTHKMLPTWGTSAVGLLTAAAADAAVDRVFVNPAIKRVLCQGVSRRAPWFARVRPWWGHHDHFHVRLKCPPASPLCTAQDPPAAGNDDDDGCGTTLSWWFSPDAIATQARRKSSDADHGPTLPDACAALVPAATP